MEEQGPRLPWDGEMLQGWPVMALVEGRVVMNRLKDPE